MSLHHAAQHLAEQGRNGDSMLVHMTPHEVSGLQTLLQSKGRDLTVNPHTGLPEAWFGSDLGGSLYDSAKGITSGIGGAVQDMTSSPIGSMLVGAALVACGVPPQFAGLATGAMSYASGNSFKQSVGSGLAGQGGGSMVNSAGYAGALNPSDAVAPTAPGGAVPAAVPGAPPVTSVDVLNTAPATAPATAPVDVSGAAPATTTAPTGAQAISEATHPSMSVAPVGSSAATQAASSGFMDTAGKWVAANPGYAMMGAAGVALAGGAGEQHTVDPGNPYEGAYIRPYTYDQKTGKLTQIAPVKAPVKIAQGGLLSIAGGGPVEQMSNQNAVGANQNYPMAGINQAAYATPYQTPMSQNVLTGSSDVAVDPYTGEQKLAAGGAIQRFGWGGLAQSAQQVTDGTGGFNEIGNPFAGGIAPLIDKLRAESSSGLRPYTYDQKTGKLAQVDSVKAPYTGEQKLAAGGGISSLGGYSDGGHLLKGPGDGVSDSIPATIGDRQPARLADGEFVVPARIVSELGNGSTDAGARQLYKMMERIQTARGNTVGKNKVATNTRAAKHLPA